MNVTHSTIILCALMLAGNNVKAQDASPVMPVDPDTKLITYKEVVTVTGTPNELFNRTIEWVNAQYKNPTVATKVRNPSTGIIEIAHRIELVKEKEGVMLPAGIVDYTMKIELKDNRYRYVISHFNLKDISPHPIEVWMDKSNKAYNPAWDIYLKQVDTVCIKLIESLKLALQPPAAKKTDEW